MIKRKKSIDISKQSKESIYWSITVMPILQIVQFAASIVIARLLEPKDFGIMGMAGVIIFYSNSISEFGLGDSIIRIKNKTDRHVDTFFTINITISLILAIFFLVCADFIAGFFRTKELGAVIRVLSCIFIITSFYTVPLALLRRSLSYKLISKIEIIKRIGGIVCTLTLALLGFGYWALICGTISANIIAVIAIMYVVDWQPRLGFHFEAFREIYSFAFWKFISVQINMLGSYVDKLVIGKVLGPIMLGFYEKSFGIAFMPVQNISQRITSVMFSTFSRVKGEPGEIRYYFSKTLTMVTVFCFPVLIGLYAIADQFVMVLLGEKWQPMVPVFRVLLVAFLFASLATCFDTLNLACGSYRKQVFVKIFSLLMMLLFLLVYAKNGIVHVGYIIIIYNITLLLLSYFISRSVGYLSLTGIVLAILPALLATLFMGCSLYCIDFYLKSSNCSAIYSLVIFIVVGMLSYSLFIMLSWFKQTSFLRKEVVNKVSSVFNKF